MFSIGGVGMLKKLIGNVIKLSSVRESKVKFYTSEKIL